MINLERKTVRVGATKSKECWVATILARCISWARHTRGSPVHAADVKVLMVGAAHRYCPSPRGYEI